MIETKEVGKKRGKENGYSSAVLQAKRNRKRQEAEARQRHYDGLTTKQKTELAKSRRGESKRELARLAELNKVQNKVAREVVDKVLADEKKAKRVQAKVATPA